VAEQLRTRRPAAHPRRARADAPGSSPPNCTTTGPGPSRRTRCAAATSPRRRTGRPARAGQPGLAMLVLDAVPRATRVARPGLPACQGRRQHDRPPRRAGGAGGRRMPPLAEPALERFHTAVCATTRWSSTSGSCCRPAPERGRPVFARVKALLQHPDFSLKNPNRARSLLCASVRHNPAPSTAPTPPATCSGPSRCWSIDAINPQLAARLARAMDRWRVLAEPYRSAAREALPAWPHARPDTQRRRARDRHQSPRRTRLPIPETMNETHQPDPVPGRTAARTRPHPAAAAPADRGGGARLQAHRHLGQQGRAGRRAGQRRQRERAGRGPEEARRHRQRGADRGQRVGRPPGRHGQRGDGQHPRGAQPLPAGRVPAAVRPAGRQQQHRRQRQHRHHLLGAAQGGQPRAASARRTSCSPASSRPPPATASTARRPRWC
jgi:hypothetical protein